MRGGDSRVTRVSRIVDPVEIVLASRKTVKQYLLDPKEEIRGHLFREI